MKYILLFFFITTVLFTTPQLALAQNCPFGTDCTKCSTQTIPGNCVEFCEKCKSQAQIDTTHRFGLDKVSILSGLCKDVNPKDNKCDTQDARKVMFSLIQYMLGFLSIIAFLMVIYGGFMWTTAAGSEERVDKGRKILKWAVIGLVVTFSAWTIIIMIMKTASRLL